MDIIITGRHLELKNSVKEYAREKLSHVDRFFGGISSIEVVFKQEDRKIHCEVIIHVKRHETIVIDVARDEFNEAIDVAVDKCERQLRRLKEKVEDKRPRRQNGADSEGVVEAAGEEN